MPNQNDIPTGAHTPVTLEVLRDAIFDRLDAHEAKQDAALIEIERHNVDRHTTIMTTLQQHEKRLNNHDSDIKGLRDGRFPQAPLWALFVAAILIWLTIGVAIFLMVLHAAAPHLG
jgi:hypothetical protein